MTLNYDKMVILRIAKYYYLDGLSQQEISQKENIHRSQISRILKLARELGYVQIKISSPDSYAAEFLAKRLEHGLSLSEAFVAPSISTQMDPDEALYFFAARHLEQVLPHYKNIGIGVGKTLYNVASQLTTQHTENKPDFYSVAGPSGTDNPYLQASVILDNFSRPFNGQCHYNNLPICMLHSTMSPLIASRLAALQKAYQMLDMVVLSIGEPFNLDYPYFEEFSLAAKEMDMTGALMRPHGNLLGHVFYEDDSSLNLPENLLFTSMSLQMLQKNQNVVCIAHGRRKIGPIISAARHGYIKTLVTDESTARGILESIKYS